MPNKSCARIDKQRKSRTGPNPLQKQVAPASKDLCLSSSPTGLDNEEKNCLSSMEHMGLSLSPPLLSRPQQQRPTWEEQGHHSLFLFFSLFSQGWKEQRPDHGSKNSSLSLLLLGCHLQQNQRQGRREAGAYLFSSQAEKAFTSTPTTDSKDSTDGMNEQRAKEVKSPRSPQ